MGNKRWGECFQGGGHKDQSVRGSMRLIPALNDCFGPLECVGGGGGY